MAQNKNLKNAKRSVFTLEFHRCAKMGDALLEIILIDLIYKDNIPVEDRSWILLTFRSNNVISTFPIIIKPKGFERTSVKYIGDCVEASIYWMYQNYGYNYTRAFVGRQIKKHIENGIHM